MPDISYDDAIKIMRTFVKNKLIPSQDKYTEAPKVDKEAVTKLFYDLARLLLGDYPETQKFINSLKLEGPEDIDMAWEKLYEEILLRKRAFEFDWKARKDDFIPILKELIVNNGINIEWLFITKYGKEYRQMTQGAIRQRIKKLGKILGIEDLYPHSLRKTSINLINNLAGLGLASSYANHTSSGVTSKHYIAKANPTEIRNSIINARKKLGIF